MRAIEAWGDLRRGASTRAGWIQDVTGEHWVLEGVPCPIVRYRLDKPRA